MTSKFNTYRLIALAVIIVGAVAPFVWTIGARINRAEREKWPPPVLSMQDLPPLDRSKWPKTPLAWKTETVETEIAALQGPKTIPITYFTNSIGMKLARIEPGAFRMGLTEREAWRFGKHDHLRRGYLTAHQVTLTHGYYLGAYEVTNAQFERFDSNLKERRPDYQRADIPRREFYVLGPEVDQHPVQPITWQEAQQFCRWLSVKEGRLYRLPTEAEWEYACRAGTSTRLYWGDDVWNRNLANLGGSGDKKEHLAWGEDGFIYTAPVGVYPANPWGLFDTIGNAREWVADWFGPFSAEPATDPKGPQTGHSRVQKGGGWNSDLGGIHSSWRDGDQPHDLKDIVGFRVLCELE